jgi:hypothetical protein
MTKPSDRDAPLPAAVSAETCGLTRAQSLVASGLVNAAAQITELANSLTASVMEAVEIAMAEGGDAAFVNDLDCFRTVVFSGIARNIIERIEQRLRAEPEKRDVLSIPPDPDKWVKLEQAKKSHGAWLRRNRRNP